ncbi:MAG: hypothetical protein DMG21_10890 [Acidobacteria bacterium]|nr:MAG: hypothetical protein DMG21_10890 [Acidobacteriota bacterium]
MRKPPFISLLFALIPFTAICFSAPLWDRIDPKVLGLPFNLFWLISWVILTPVSMAFAYLADRRRAASRSRGRKEDP